MIDNNMLGGELFSKMLILGAANFKKHIKEINDLNVFPVPDGDTGDNMFMTLSGGIKEVIDLKSPSISEVSKKLAKGMLLSARGNSGVIFSQLFSGFAKGIGDKKEVNIIEVYYALKSAVKQAYSAVSVPIEGTMLTIARETAEKLNIFLREVKNGGEFGEICLREVKKSLNRTPDLLPVLKEAGVVDSGGAGLYYFIEGMVYGLEGKNLEDISEITFDTIEKDELDFSKFNKDSVMTYGYCTECLVQLQSKKVDVDAFDIALVTGFLEKIGDSVVAIKNDSIVKLHVHTLTPHKVLEFCQQYGEFLTVKIENMTLQHNETSKNDKTENKREHKKFALVTVALGKGLTETFYNLGADIVIEGGQTKNPSVQDFVNAFKEVNADEIFVLPNNSNIIMAAQKAAEIYKDSKIHLIKTKNLGQAYAILTALDYTSNDGELIAGGMIESMEGVLTASITSSVRDANINNVVIKSGEYIGFTDKEMLVSNRDKIKTLEGLLEKINIEDRYFIFIVYGENVTEEEKEKTRSLIKEKYDDIEFYELDGGQEVYDYILIIE